jgi:hypothetical protein
MELYCSMGKEELVALDVCALVGEKEIKGGANST